MIWRVLFFHHFSVFELIYYDFTNSVCIPWLINRYSRQNTSQNICLKNSLSGFIIVPLWKISWHTGWQGTFIRYDYSHSGEKEYGQFQYLQFNYCKAISYVLHSLIKNIFAETVKYRKEAIHKWCPNFRKVRGFLIFEQSQ